jgi:AcrR family transcriptional regulator
VSVRSIFQHFEDLEGLYAAVADRYLERAGNLAFQIESDLALPDRVAAAVSQRCQMLEILAPTRRAANVHAPFSEAVNTRLHLAHDLARSEVERVFGALGENLQPAERRLFFDSLSSALSWMVWDNLRTFIGRSPEEAEAVVTQLVWGVLARRETMAAEPKSGDAA